MGREKFLERVWEWKAESGGAIINQLKRLGASADWSRERFTLGERGAPDDQMVRAVTKVIVDLYNKGLIYRDKRLVNWHPGLETAISDLEVENIEVNGHMWHLRYPLADGVTYEFPVAYDEAGNPTAFETRDYIVVATPRPEPMLGDTGVAAGRSPYPDRWRHLRGPDARFGRGQDHTGARLQRFRSGTAERPRHHQHFHYPRRHRPVSKTHLRAHETKAQLE